MPHLEAMARERYAMFLLTQNELELANDQIASAYWLYYDWGAHGKSVAMAWEYPFLKTTKREQAVSITSRRTESVSESVIQPSAGIVKRQGTYDFNSTCKYGKCELCVVVTWLLFCSSPKVWSVSIFQLAQASL
jgi:hypothetical protein